MAIYKDYEMPEKTGSEFYSGFCDYQMQFMQKLKKLYLYIMIRLFLWESKAF
ncbi:unknown [Roseburia sp. CAG:182]|nr:unknown [Roseburia sp. CAG:182]